jgi:hypothetical protein
MINFNLLPQPLPQDAQSPDATYKWLYRVWLKLRGTDTDLSTVSGQTADTQTTATDALAKATDALLKIAALGSGSQWPIGCYYFNNGANPSTALGFGTWSLVSQGQFIVGRKAGDPNFGTNGATGGNETHKHSVDVGSTASSTPSATVNAVTVAGDTAVGSGAHTHNVDPAAVDSSIVSNIPPFFVLSVWERTA